MNSFYIHNINPVLLPIWGHLAIRWYGLAYVAGFIAGYVMLKRMIDRGEFALTVADLQSYMINLVIGVMAGGRLGYILFYDFHQFLQDPLVIFRLWEGGMASHGGMIGLAVALWYSSRRYRVPLLHLSDALVCVGPVGLFFGRMANFINGELWGRVTTVPWAVVFPLEAGIEPGTPGVKDAAIALVNRGLLHPRHPSQLYQAALEGIVLLTVLQIVRKTKWAAPQGRLTGLFFCLYAVFRFFTEFFREPEIVHFGWVTQGQLLSVLLLLPAGIYLIGRAQQKQA